MKVFRALVSMGVLAFVALDARAQDEAAEPDPDVEVMVVQGSRTATATTREVVPAEEFQLRPLESGGQMIEAVPGAITAQHTGGGKAEQYFLRGFDADHGTDLAVYFDGVPINLRSHAHGQGFLDLHFVTKETIERLEVQKGPYSPRFGDFATAATIEYVPYDVVDESSLKVEGGEFDTLRAVGVFTPRTLDADTLVAFEAYHTDGPFRNEEDLERYSAFLRGEVDLSPDVRLFGHLLGYTAEWNAAGLIPERLVDADVLSRFGSLDPTEGGESHRLQGRVGVGWDVTPTLELETSAYLLHYDLDLFSNFTFALEDPVSGDGLVQRDDRIQTGGRTDLSWTPDVPFVAGATVGFEWRYDDAHVRLGPQTMRTRLAPYGNDDDVRETSLASYAQLDLQPLSWVSLAGGLRFETFLFDVESNLPGGADGDGRDELWMPKATLVLSPFADDGLLPSSFSTLRDLELFGHVGVGFHSNDARSGVVNERILAEATGAEGGVRTSFFDRLFVSSEVFWLEIEDELTFVGDAGETESGGRTRRLGVEVAAHLFLTSWLYARGDASYTEARFTDDETPVSQAPRFIAKGAVGATWQGLTVELGARHLGERHASEDFRSPKLSDYTVLDLGAAWRRGPFEVGVAVENLTDTEWRSSEFFFASCAPSEVGVPATAAACPAAGGGQGIDDFHFTPGNRRNVRGFVRVRF